MLSTLPDTKSLKAPERRPLRARLHGAIQLLRLGWYAAHHLLANKLRGPLRPGGQPLRLKARPPGRKRILAAVAELLERDRRRVAAGRCPPAPLRGNPFRGLANSIRFFADLRRFDRRRLARDCRQAETPERRRIYPPYYLRNFHYQTDGYFSEYSAALYDTQVEILFAGCAAPMRRQALPMLADFLARRPADARLLDLACGTAPLLADLRRAHPRLSITGLDLSHPYLRRARRRNRAARFAQGLAERLPFAPQSFDAVCAVYLFHELPPPVRRASAQEIARVLKPGGLFLCVDSIQTGDAPNLDALLEIFPQGVHEPYFATYLREDFPAMMRAAGLNFITAETALLSKISGFVKAPARAP